jgi:uncharacterized NAD-dependent epimerase/dehydratase family protein
MKNFKKAALMVEGAKDIFQSKTASALLRYRLSDCAFLIDNTHSTNKPNIYSGSGLKVVNSITDVKNETDALVLCMVLPEGTLPSRWIEEIVSAIKNNIDIINPLHINFGTIPQISSQLGGVDANSTEYKTMFKNSKAVIYNIRVVPSDLELFSLKVLQTKAKRVLTVGSDCNIGKMLTTLELNRLAQDKGFNSSFIATGQIGILIKGSGIAVDRVICDFLPGAIERLILEEQNKDVLFVEGQGSIFQPIYSGVTLGLIHGTAPDAMVFCHVPSRKKLRYTDINIPDYKFMIRMHEEISSIVNKTKVVGISLNCFDLSKEQALDEIKRAEDITGLPATDPVKFGSEKLIDSVTKYLFTSRS